MLLRQVLVAAIKQERDRVQGELNNLGEPSIRSMSVRLPPIPRLGEGLESFNARLADFQTRSLTLAGQVVGLNKALALVESLEDA